MPMSASCQGAVIPDRAGTAKEELFFLAALPAGVPAGVPSCIPDAAGAMRMPSLPGRYVFRGLTDAAFEVIPLIESARVSWPF